MEVAKKGQHERACGDGNALYLDYMDVDLLVVILHLSFASVTLGKTG